MARLLTALRDELTAAGIVRDPDTANPNLAPFWRAPRLGVPSPGETPPSGNTTNIGRDAVVGAYVTGGIPPGPYEGDVWRTDFVEVRIRSRSSIFADDLEDAITKRIIDRRNFDLGGTLRIIECQQVIPLQMLVNDPQGFEHLTTYAFQIYAP